MITSPTRIACRDARRLAWLPTLLAVLGLAALNGPTRGQAPPSAEAKTKIDEIQKQIDDLTKKRDAVRKADAEANAVFPSLGPEWVKPLAWRALGPANMGGRITALAVVENDPSTYWVATAGGGLLKTVNNGLTFEHQFDKESTVSIGDVAVAPSNANVVWIGTGESNPRNSVSYGDGVYKSIDGGKTWKNVGLKNSYQIGKIAVHPKDPNTAYVGVLGRLYGPSAERGLFKTADGGKTWNKVLYVDDKTGVVDLRISPADPETLIAASYERKRDLYDTGDPVQKFGAGGGLHKTTDGGKTWKKLTTGLPTVKLGRIGIDYYQKDPKTVFAIIESEKIGGGPRPKAADATNQAYLGVSGEGPEAAGATLSQVVPDGPGDKAGLKIGDVVKEADGKPIKLYTEFVEALRAKKVGDKFKLKVEREGKAVEVEAALEARPAGQGAGQRRPPTGQGQEPTAAKADTPPTSTPSAATGESGEGIGQFGLDPVNRPFGSSLGGQIENAQDRQGPDSYQTGGVYKSTDGGDTWTRINSLNPRPFYFSQVRVDPSDDQYVYVLGLAVHRSNDGGKTFRGDGGRAVHSDHHALWIDPRNGRHMVLAGDGGPYLSNDRGNSWDHLNHMAIGQFYHVALDTRRFYKVYGGLQDNGTWGGPALSRPSGFGGGGGGGTLNEDWVNVNGGDGFHVAVDPTDPDLVYGTSQYGVLMRRNFKTGQVASIRPEADKGKTYRFNWNTPFLLSSHNPKIYYAAGNVVFRSWNRGENLRPISPEVTRTPQGSATALAESPKNADVLYVGTDDGALWVTRNGGKDWTDVTKNVGLDRPCFVATIEASRAVEGRAYVAFDGHRSDTDEPLVFATEDFGKSWTALKANLPRGSSRCLREDIENHDLLYLGTEFAVWASLDRGKTWLPLNTNLPTVAIHEVAIHPTAGEIVVATHGRSLWALDVSGLRQLTRETLKSKAALLKPTPVVRWQSEPSRGSTNRKFIGQNPPRGAVFYVALPSKAAKAALKIFDFSGEVVYTLTVPTEPGLHKLAWSLNRLNPRTAVTAGGGGLNRFFRGPSSAAPGTYKTVLTVDGQEFTRPLTIEADPAYPNVETSAEVFEESDEDEPERDGRREIDID